MSERADDIGKQSRIILSVTETDQFITYYLGQDILWNAHHVNYSKRDHRQAAIKTIQMQMASQGRMMTPEQVTSKISSLRTYYGRELRKVLASEKSGTGTDDIYKSTWEFFSTLDPFLRSHVQQRPSSCNMEREAQVDGSYQSPSTTYEEQHIVPVENVLSTPQVPGQIGEPPSKKQKVTTEQLNGLMFNTLKNISERRSAKQDPDADILFGQQIGLELKKVTNLKKRQELKLKIQQLIFAYTFEIEI